MMRTAVQLGFNGYGVLGRLPETDLARVLDMVQYAGFDGVEVMSNVADVPASRALLAKCDLEVAAVHLFLPDLESPARRQHWIAIMRETDCRRLAVSAFGMDQTSSGYAELAARLRPVHDDLAARGSELFFHCHDAELSVVSHDGVRGVDVLIKELPDLRLVVDTYWTAKAGIEPAGFVQAHAARSGYYHLKDGDASGGTGFGEGTIPMEDVLRTAVACNARSWAVLEQESPASDMVGTFKGFHDLVTRATQESPA